MSALKRPRKLYIALICVVVGIMQAWIILETAPGLLVYASIWMGIVGAYPLLLLSVHGDWGARLIGAVMFVILNASIYYGAVILLIRLKRKFYPERSS